MSKYQPLSDRLGRHPDDEWRATFAEIEAVLGFPLPKAARTGKAWWAAADKPHSRAWIGWAAHDIDQAKGAVTFRRLGAEAPETFAPLSPPPEAPARSGPPPAVFVAGAAALAVGLGALVARTLLRRR